jgi:hypothetical protein
MISTSAGGNGCSFTELGTDAPGTMLKIGLSPSALSFKMIFLISSFNSAEIVSVPGSEEGLTAFELGILDPTGAVRFWLYCTA